MRAEYGMTAPQVADLSWRAFMSYVHGLMWRESSAWRAWVLATTSDTDTDPEATDGAVATPAQAQAALTAILGSP